MSMYNAYHDLLRLCKVVDGIGIQSHDTELLKRRKLLWQHLCRV